MAAEFEEFDMTVEANNIFSLEIVTTQDNRNCFIRTKDNFHKYEAIILDRNSRSKVLCYISFYPSSANGKFIPRLTFKRKKVSGIDTESKKVNIDLSDGNVSMRFWKMIAFLDKFKDIVDRGGFEDTYSVVPKDVNELFNKLGSSEKVKFLTGIISSNTISSSDVNAVLCSARKLVLSRFLHLLKNYKYKTGTTSRETYREVYKVTRLGDEAIWHHFLKENEWILGINADIRYIRQFIDEANVGIPNTSGKGSPTVDLLGLTNYTTLIELKTSDTPIFKEQRGVNARSNTWEFSNDFISGISQCLGQKEEFDHTYPQKEIIAPDGQIISTGEVYKKDTKTIFIIGCRYSEFPHDGYVVHKIKSETFELFRRNSKNIDIITYDELFERAYYIVMGEPIPRNWYKDENFCIK